RWRRDITDPRVDKDARVLELIAAYRDRGHLMADIDPIDAMYALRRRNFHPDLDVNTHELTLWDLERKFSVGGFVGKDRMGCTTCCPRSGPPTAARSASSTRTSSRTSSGTGSRSGSRASTTSRR